MQASGAAPASPATLALAVAAFILLLLALLFSRYAIDAILLLFERRRVLEPDERARLALAAPYARLWHMPDSDLAGLPPRRRQRVWNVLAGDWNIRGVRSRKRVLAQSVLDWLRDAGHRADPALVGAPERDMDRVRALLAFDCARLVYLARLCHFAGYIDESDAWQYIGAAMRRLAPAFDSWSAYGAAFLTGRALWASGDDANLTNAVAWLLRDERSPWATYPWSAAVARQNTGS
jgi:hypothetical protein